MRLRCPNAKREWQGLTALLFLSVVGSAKAADSCLPFLTGAGSRPLTLVSLDRSGEASYVPLTALEHQSSLKIPGRANGRVGTPQPEQWRTANPDTAATAQYFSSRMAGPQPFDIAKPDTLAVSITVEDSPRVSLAFRSQGMKRRKFRARCSAGGVMHGSAADADFLLLLAPAAGKDQPKP